MVFKMPASLINIYRNKRENIKKTIFLRFDLENKICGYFE